MIDNEFNLVHIMMHRGATRDELMEVFKYIIRKDELEKAHDAIIVRLANKYGKENN